jgi:hypothetical protein
MIEYKHAAHALQELQQQGVVWLILLDVKTENSGEDIAIWECVCELDLNEKGIIWKEAFLLKSANACELIENALSQTPLVQIYFNDNLIAKL